MWMSTNFLKINEGKTQFMSFTPRYQNCDILTNTCISFGGSLIFPSPEGTNLGVKFDNAMSFSSQINSITSKGYFYLNNFTRVADKCDFNLKVQMVTSYILPLIDYCNFVLVSASQSNRYKVQKLLNSAVRFIFNLHGKKRRRSITPYLSKLHILPIDYRIKYKLCLLVYKCIYNAAPQYLRDFFSLKVCYSRLRSSSDLLQLQTVIPKSSYGEFAFSYVAAKSWNDLPLEVRQASNLNVFKTSLKTYFYRCCYCN